MMPWLDDQGRGGGDPDSRGVTAADRWDVAAELVRPNGIDGRDRSLQGSPT
jgi:hypothetical protein